jgi:hypothetical protein
MFINNNSSSCLVPVVHQFLPDWAYGSGEKEAIISSCLWFTEFEYCMLQEEPVRTLFFD